MRRLLVLAGLAIALAGLPGSLAAQSAPSGSSQEGRLRILVRGQAIGSEHYEINTTATEISARAEVALQSGNQKVRQTATLVLNPDGSLRSYEWKQDEPRKSWVRMECTAGQATVHFPRDDGAEDQQVYNLGDGRVAVLDNNIFHHFLLLARFYDFAKGGPQVIPVFIPQSVQPGLVTVELQGVETLPVDGAPQPVRRLSILSEDNQLVLWVTESGRFVRLQSPQTGVEVLPDSPGS